VRRKRQLKKQLKLSSIKTKSNGNRKRTPNLKTRKRFHQVIPDQETGAVTDARTSTIPSETAATNVV